jgi:hypothetical protein
LEEELDYLQRCVAWNVANYNTQGTECGLGQQELWNGTPVMMMMMITTKTKTTTTTTMTMIIPEPQHSTNVNVCVKLHTYSPSPGSSGWEVESEK